MGGRRSGGGSGYAGERQPRGDRGLARHEPSSRGWRRPVHYATTRLYPPGTTSAGSLLHRKTGAKYNREPPWLMSRPNKAKNRPLNNARCNVGPPELLDMHGTNRRNGIPLFLEIHRHCIQRPYALAIRDSRFAALTMGS